MTVVMSKWRIVGSPLGAKHESPGQILPPRAIGIRRVATVADMAPYWSRWKSIDQGRWFGDTRSVCDSQIDLVAEREESTGCPPEFFGAPRWPNTSRRKSGSQPSNSPPKLDLDQPWPRCSLAERQLPSPTGTRLPELLR